MGNPVRFIPIIIIGLILFILITNKPHWGIALTAASMPVVSLLPPIPYLSSLVPLIGGVTLVGYLWQKRGGKLKFSPLHTMGIMFLFWITISNPEAALIGGARNWLFTFVQLWVLMYLAGELLDTPGKQQVVMLAFSAASVLSAFLAINQGFIGEDLDTSLRVYGISEGANEAARYFTISMVFITYLRSVVKNPLLKLIALVAILTTYIGVFFTVSRTGIVLIFLAQILILLLEEGFTKKVRVILLFGAGLIGLSFLSETIFNIIRSIYPSVVSGTDTVGVRYYLWRAGWRMWLDHPFTGVGIGQYFHRVGPYLRDLGGPGIWRTVAHNTYIQVFSETGIVGFGLFMLMIFSSLKNFWQSKKINETNIISLRNAWLIAFLIILIGGITKSDQANKLHWLMMGVSLYFSQENIPEEVPSKTKTNNLRSGVYSDFRLRIFR